MTIDEMKKRKIALGFTSEMISNLSGVPLGTVQKIFAGTTKAPRRHTIEALERVLRYSSADGSSTYRPEKSGIYQSERESSYPFGLRRVQEEGLLHESPALYGMSSQERLYTLDDYYALPAEHRAELIDGVFYDMAAPSAIHQLVLGQLFRLFSDCVDQHDMPCTVMIAPFDVRLDRDNYTMVQPDLMIICKTIGISGMDYLEGPPDLTVEILSPSTRSKDMLLKLYKYEKAGVREYWIVDPKNRTVTVHSFDSGESNDKEDCDPKKYSFLDQVPIGISNGECIIDFSKIQNHLTRFE